MTIEKPVKSIIYGPARTRDEIAMVILNTINHYVLRTDIIYCKKSIENVKRLYEDYSKIPLKIKKLLENIETALES